MSRRLSYAGFFGAYGIVALLLIFGKSEIRTQHALGSLATFSSEAVAK